MEKLRTQAENILGKNTGMTFDEDTYLIQTHFEYVIKSMFDFALSREVEEYWKEKFKSDAVGFGNWLGFHYYRVSGWKWHSIKNDGDSTEYSIEELYDLFTKHKTDKG